MRWTSVALLLLPIAPLSGQTLVRDPQNGIVTPDMLPLPVHIGGRVSTESLPPPLPAGARRYVHEWPGVYFEANFEGERVALKFSDSYNEYRLLIDGRPPITIAQPGNVELEVRDLGAGVHRLRLEKITESIGLIASFDGFYLPPGERPLPVRARRRQIEYIGDSSMSGYGNRSHDRSCTKEEVRLRTDTQAAYPALVAKHFDADYQINAISGRGVVRNYGGDQPDVPMSRVYPRILFDRPDIYDDPKWRPQLFVVKLNADFFKGLGPGERWPDEAALTRDYTATFGRLVQELHQRSPGAAILIWWIADAALPNQASRQSFDTAQAYIRSAAQAAVVPVIDFLVPDIRLEGSACDYHGSLGDHQRLADWLTRYLEGHPDYWGKAQAPPPSR